MKPFLRMIVAGALGLLARAILRKYRPTIVMVTGSVGKTSTKDAIAAALSERFFLRKSDKSYNSEFGLPLTVLGVKNPWTNAIAWIDVFGEAVALLVLPSHYPKLLVLEVGADRPGDLARILRIATPDVVVVTRLPEIPVHVEAYSGPDMVREEEFAPAYALASGAPLIISADDPYAKEMAARLSTRCITYGFANDAEIRISDAAFIDRVTDGAVESAGEMRATVVVAGESYRVSTPSAIGRQQVYAPAAAIAVALALNLSVKDALSGLATYAPPPGRARVLRGKNGSLLIDDTYNSSPAATEEALASLALVTGAKRRVAIIGEMRELGRFSKAEHERIGALAADTADVLIAVGERAGAICAGALENGMSELNCIGFATSKEAAEHVQDTVKEGDVVLVKGSQSIRTERITESLLHDPLDVRELVRQDKEWRKR